MPSYTFDFGGISYTMDSPRDLSIPEITTAKNRWLDSIGFKAPSVTPYAGPLRTYDLSSEYGRTPIPPPQDKGWGSTLLDLYRGRMVPRLEEPSIVAPGPFDRHNIPMVPGTNVLNKLGDLVTPEGIALSLTPAKGLPGLIGRGASIGLAGQGAYDIYQGHPIQGGLELLGGALGVKGPRALIKPKPKLPELKMKVVGEVKELAPARMTVGTIPSMETATIGQNRVAFRGTPVESFETQAGRTFPQTTGSPDIVLPNRLRPPTPNETAYNALIPERYKPQTEVWPSTGPAVSPAAGSFRNVEGRKVWSGQTDIPANAGSIGEQIPLKPPTRSQISFGESKLLEPSRVKAEKTINSNPATREAAQKNPKIVDDLAEKMEEWNESKGHNFLRPIEETLERDSPSGKEVSWMLKRVSSEFRQLATKWQQSVDKIYSGLKKSEHEEFFLATEDKVKSTNPRVLKAIQEIRKLDAEVVAEARKAGLQNPEYQQLMVFRKNYAPHMRPEGETLKSLVENIMKRYPKIGKNDAIKVAKGIGDPNLVDRVMAATGVDRPTAERIIQLGKKRSERKIGSQFSRAMDLPGYRTDINAWKEHMADMARKITEQKYYGMKDLADPDSPLSKLLEKTTDPQRMRELVSIHIGRTSWGPFAKGEHKINRTAAAAASAMYLSQFAISNIAGIVPTILHAGPKATSKALLKTLITARPGTREFAAQSGALYNVTRGILEAAQNFKVSKLYGITAAENFQRTIAAVAGKDAVQTLFKQLKNGTISKKDVPFLEDLLLTKSDDLLKQAGLTEQQIKTAGGRMAEITQGLAEARRLPSWASNASPWVQIPLLFKKYAYQNTVSIKNAIKRHPAKNTAYLLAASQLVGEGLGDIKAGIRGGVKGLAEGDNPAKEALEEIKHRHEWIGKYQPMDNQVITRMVDNLSQAWALGLAGDFYLALGKPEGIISLLGGPVGSMVSEAGYGAYQAAKGKFGPISRQGLRAIPVIGSGLQRGLAPTQFQTNLERQRNSKLKNLKAPEYQSQPRRTF